LLAYFLSYLKPSEETGDRESKAFRQSNFFEFIQKAYRMRVVYTTKLDPHKKYMFACHPHGLIPFGWMCIFQSQFANSPLVAGASIIFRLPVMRDMTLWAGGINATDSAISNAFQKGRSVALFPGGVREMMLSKPGNDVCIVNKSRGFARLAIEHQVDIVPVFSFSEQNVYAQQLLGPVWFQKWLKKLFGFYAFVPRGREWFGILPNLDRLTVVCGSPIRITSSSADVEVIHRQYYDELMNLIRNSKDRLGFGEHNPCLSRPNSKL